jgi:hypothetical protein
MTKLVRLDEHPGLTEVMENPEGSKLIRKIADVYSELSCKEARLYRDQIHNGKCDDFLARQLALRHSVRKAFEGQLIGGPIDRDWARSTVHTILTAIIEVQTNKILREDDAAEEAAKAVQLRKLESVIAAVASNHEVHTLWREYRRFQGLGTLSKQLLRHDFAIGEPELLRAKLAEIEDWQQVDLESLVELEESHLALIESQYKDALPYLRTAVRVFRMLWLGWRLKYSLPIVEGIKLFGRTQVHLVGPDGVEYKGAKLPIKPPS